MSKFERTFTSLINFTPVLLMSILALFSFVLVKNSPQISTVTQGQLSANAEQDYYLQNFSTTRYGTTGNANAYVGGKGAEHLERSNELIIRDIHFRFYKFPHLYEGKANKGVLSDDANLIQLSEQVSVKRISPTKQANDVFFHSQSLTLVAN